MNGNNRETFIKHILNRLDACSDQITADFTPTNGRKPRYSVIEDLLPAEHANAIASAFPESSQMRLLDSFREKKYTSKALGDFDHLVSEITFAFQDVRVVKRVSELCGLQDAVGDPHLYAGGISAMERGHFLQPHIDNSHDGERKYYRVLNLLYYVTPDWKAENGGNLELWDEAVQKAVEIPSLFNRLVLMETNDKSWHSVNEVRSNGSRQCISNYYFSPHSPNGYETFHVTYFMARPEQKLLRVLTKADSELRSLLRKFKKDGLAKKDVFDGRNSSD